MCSDRSRSTRWKLSYGLVVVLVTAHCQIALARHAIAQPQPHHDEFSFDIVAQPLADALVAYARVTGVEILIDDNLVVDRQSATINGAFHSVIALRHMLAGTGLEIQYVDRGAITLVRRGVPTDWANTRDDQLSAFTAALQAALARTMCVDGYPASGRIVVQLWIGQKGAVEQSLLLDTTGDRDRDAAITRRLNAMKVGRTRPVDLPQPATVIFAPQRGEDCAEQRGGRLP